jgi:quercetin dioxygenase-like cupin family protein
MNPTAAVMALLAALSGCGTHASAVQSPAAPANAAGGGAAPGAERTEISRALAATGGVATFKAGTETVVLKVVLQPGGSTGWHSHYDGGMFLINKGVVTSYGLDSPLCKPVELRAGHALFVPPHAHHQHLVRNDGAETAEATVYYFNVPPGSPTGRPAVRPAACSADLK